MTAKTTAKKAPALSSEAAGTKKPKKASPKKTSSRAAPKAPKVDERLPRLTVAVGSLRAALADVLGCISTRAEIPILSHVHLSCSGSTLRLTGTDLDRWVTRDLAIDAQVEWRGFDTCLPAQALADLLKAMTGGETLTFTAPHGDEPRAVIETESSCFRIVALGTDDFPMPKPFTPKQTFEMTAGALVDAIAGVAHAISTEETRYYLNGILLEACESPEQLRFIATDGHRLARIALDRPQGAGEWPNMIIPRGLIAQLTKLLEPLAKKERGDKPEITNVLVETDGAEVPYLRLAFEVEDDGEIDIIAKSIDGSFPDYRRVIPRDPPNHVTVNKHALESGLRLVSAIASDKTRAVRLEIATGEVVMRTISPTIGEARERIAASLSGQPITIGFNAPYLLAALGALPSEQVRLGYDDAGAAVLVSGLDPDIETDRLVQVVMPVNV